MGDYGFARQRQQGYGSYESRQPMLHSYSSRSTVATDSSETTLASPPTPRARKPNWGDIDNVQLNKGNLVLNCPLPTDLINAIPKKVHEFGCMRYSAVTCDPLKFTENRFALRQQLFQQRRRTELFIVITMYAEDEILFAKTMIGVFRNIEYMCKTAKEAMWGEDGWKKIVVCVVSDGRKKIHPKTRSLLAAMGCFQHDIAKYEVNNIPVQAHLYEVSPHRLLISAEIAARVLNDSSAAHDTGRPPARGRKGESGSERPASTRADSVLPQGEQRSEDQLSPVVLRSVRPGAGPPHLRADRCRDEAGQE